MDNQRIPFKLPALPDDQRIGPLEVQSLDNACKPNVSTQVSTQNLPLMTASFFIRTSKNTPTASIWIRITEGRGQQYRFNAEGEFTSVYCPCVCVIFKQRVPLQRKRLLNHVFCLSN